LLPGCAVAAHGRRNAIHTLFSKPVPTPFCDMLDITGWRACLAQTLGALCSDACPSFYSFVLLYTITGTFCHSLLPVFTVLYHQRRRDAVCSSYFTSFSLETMPPYGWLPSCCCLLRGALSLQPRHGVPSAGMATCLRSAVRNFTGGVPSLRNWVKAGLRSTFMAIQLAFADLSRAGGAAGVWRGCSTGRGTAC